MKKILLSNLPPTDDLYTGTSGTLNGWHRGSVWWHRGSVSDLNDSSTAACLEFITSHIDS